MGKRKNSDTSDASESYNHDEEEEVPKPKKAKKESKSKSKAKAAEEIVVRTTSEGESYIDLGKKKRATVRVWNKALMVDIREFYGSEGDEKPGKKGISLTAEQWHALKQAAGTIDELLAATPQEKK